MKKTICVFFAFAALFFGNLQAEEESFNIGWTHFNPDNAFLMNNDSGSFLQVAKDASLTFSVDAAADTAENIRFGVDIYELDGSFSQQVFENLSAGDVFSVNFNAGQSLNFWMEIDGVRVGFIDGSTSSLVSYYSSYDSSEPSQMGLAFRDDRMSKTEGYWNTLIHVEAGAAVASLAKTASGEALSKEIWLALVLTIAAIAPFLLRKEKLHA